MRTLLLVSVLIAASSVVAADPLGPYNVDPKQITAGGLSAGAFFAVQYHVAFSSEIKGVAVFAGGPFYCSQGQLTTAEISCMNAIGAGPATAQLVTYTHNAAAAGHIDPVSNLANARVYLYSGVLDTVVKPKVVHAAGTYYSSFLNNNDTIVSDFSVLSEHCYPTVNYGERCSKMGTPFIGLCNFDGAGRSLTALYGTLKPKTTAVAANLMQFDQTKSSSVPDPCLLASFEWWSYNSADFALKTGKQMAFVKAIQDFITKN